MGVPANGEYGISDLIFGYPVTCKDGKYTIIEGLDVSEFSRGRIDASARELSEERDAVKHLLG